MLTRDQITACLRDRGLPFGLRADRPDEAEVLLDTAALTGLTLTLRIAGGGILLFDWRLPLSAPPDRVAAVCEYLTRVNHAVLPGGFVFDLDRGRIGYRAVLLCPRDTFDPALFDRMFDLCTGMIDRYAPGLAAVLFGGCPAREAAHRAGL